MFTDAEWGEARDACENRALLAHLRHRVPRDQWARVRGGSERRTLLHLAASCGDAVAVATLARAGVEVDAVDGDGQTALHLAAHVGASRRALRYLIAAGARVDARTTTGANALHLALVGNNWNCVLELLRQGARTATLGSDMLPRASRWMRSEERKRSHCRVAVVALLGLVRRRRCWVEVALECWATRAHEFWTWTGNVVCVREGRDGGDQLSRASGSISTGSG